MWGSLAVRRLWYQFTASPDDLLTQTIEKFMNILVKSRINETRYPYYKYVRIIDLQQLPDVANDILESLLTNSPYVEKLLLENYAWTTGEMNKIAPLMPNVRCIGMSNMLVEDELEPLPTYCKHLEELELGADILCTSEVLTSITKECPKLTILRLFSKGYDDQEMSEILKNIPNLRELRISECFCITEAFFQNVISICRELEMFSFYRGFIEISVDNVIKFAQHFAKATKYVFIDVVKLLDVRIECNSAEIMAAMMEPDVDKIIKHCETLNLDSLSLLYFILDSKKLDAICERLDVRILKLERIDGVDNKEILEAIKKTKKIDTIIITFKSPLFQPLRDEDIREITRTSSIKHLEWQCSIYDFDRQQRSAKLPMDGGHEGTEDPKILNELFENCLVLTEKSN
ncbi:10185_t:CDS:2 [Paraglomus brasilianum]|uniref:10185_t:CDS:1 n=1 Tax=Paraglomus brasilianum TaxID=144538 RepID=A0A9N9D991_9GLOM|nr:10185_t:CDS:2 [Paraglomus brasilianum]